MSVSKTIKVSVIVPCYNYGVFIAECLNSIKSQTFKEWECIVVDNASTDNTKDVVKKFVDEDNRFKYIFTEVKGVSHARNLGVSQSSGKYILPVDADDKIHPALIEKALSVHESNEQIMVVYSDAELFGNSSGTWILPEYSFKSLLIENSIFCTAMYKRVDFDKVKGYNENMKEGFEDWDFWISMLVGGGKVYKIPEVLFYYRIRENSRNSSLDHSKQLRLRELVFKNHQRIYEENFSTPQLIFDNYLLSTKLSSIEKSSDYKFGKILLSPVRFIKSLFK